MFARKLSVPVTSRVSPAPHLLELTMEPSLRKKGPRDGYLRDSFPSSVHLPSTYHHLHYYHPHNHYSHHHYHLHYHYLHYHHLQYLYLYRHHSHYHHLLQHRHLRHLHLRHHYLRHHHSHRHYLHHLYLYHHHQYRRHHACRQSHFFTAFWHVRQLAGSTRVERQRRNEANARDSSKWEAQGDGRELESRKAGGCKGSRTVCSLWKLHSPRVETSGHVQPNESRQRQNYNMAC